MLSFQKQIVNNFMTEGKESGLVVLSLGLGVETLVQQLIDLHATETKLVFVLNLSPHELETVNASLLLKTSPGRNAEKSAERKGGKVSGKAAPSSSSGPSFAQRLTVITSETSVAQRQNLYLTGGCFSVTNRILVVDLLNDLVPVDLVTGVLVTHAERVGEDSTEAFIIRVFRSKSNGFVKAFSDDPRGFTHGFSKAQKTMQSLMLDRLELWPRFHSAVIADLQKPGYAPEVIELYPSLTAKMALIQKSIGEVIQACLFELKQQNKDALSEVSIEDCLFRNASAVVRRALLPVWDKVTAKSKSLIGDLRTLSRLLEHLLTCDCVRFYQILRAFRNQISAGSTQSVWLFTRAADALFTHARDRVFKVPPHEGVPLNKLNSHVLRQGGVQPVLEENPKWGVLNGIIAEIRQEVTASKRRANQWSGAKGDEKGEKGGEAGAGRKGEGSSVGDPPPPPLSGRVLVVAREQSTCAMLRRCLVDGGGAAQMKAKWRGFLAAHKKRAKRFTFDENGRYLPKQIEKIALRLGLDAAANAAAQSSSVGAAQRAKNAESKVGGSAAGGGQRKGYGQKRPQNQSSGNGSGSGNKSKRYRRQQQSGLANPATAGSSGDGLQAGGGLGEWGDSWDEIELSKVSVGECCVMPAFTVMVHPLEGANLKLGVFKPEFVVIYDPDVRLLRQIELHKAAHPHLPLKVYFVAYAASVELQQYETTLSRERRAFKSLSQQKRHLTVLLPDLQNPLKGLKAALCPDATGLASSLSFNNSIFRDNTVTRRGGEKKTGGGGSELVVVDVREFRSGLPFNLFQRGMQVVPATLEVGDYIITPDVAIERKSVPDLLGGLSSGRLHSQLQAMCRCYKQPVLLIEFSNSRAFGFHHARLNDEISGKDITSKLSLLALHFPAVRWIWSKNPEFTAKTIARLKHKKPQPVVSEAMRVGTDLDLVANPDLDIPREILLQIPGVTDANVRKLASHVENLLQLSQMTQSDLSKLVGSVPAKKIHEFMHRSC